ncbi:hypothetical protein GCM10009682_41040 [Luedemannella flava]|uniref:Uncharacterized protein n=1 Tax=Luedemannella flava TaxID=349316 RepID=A0ABP4YLT1_9ACTN
MFIWGIAKNKFGMLILGLIMVGAGVYLLNQDKATCGGEVMQAGDVCVTSRAGVETGESTTEETLKNQKLGGYALTGIGGVLAIAGIVRIIVGARGKDEESAQPSAPVASA